MTIDDVKMFKCESELSGNRHSTRDEAFVLCENQSGYVATRSEGNVEVRGFSGAAGPTADSLGVVCARATCRVCDSVQGKEVEGNEYSVLSPGCRGVGMHGSSQRSEAHRNECPAFSELQYRCDETGKTAMTHVAQVVSVKGGSGLWASPAPRDPPSSKAVPVLVGGDPCRPECCLPFSKEVISETALVCSAQADEAQTAGWHVVDEERSGACKFSGDHSSSSSQGSNNVNDKSVCKSARVFMSRDKVFLTGCRNLAESSKFLSELCKELMSDGTVFDGEALERLTVVQRLLSQNEQVLSQLSDVSNSLYAAAGFSDEHSEPPVYQSEVTFLDEKIEKNL